MPKNYELDAVINEPNIDFSCAVDDDDDIAFFVIDDTATPDHSIVSVDVSDPLNPVIVDTLPSTTIGTNEQPFLTLNLDPQNNRLLTTKRSEGVNDAGRGTWLIGYDSQGNMTLFDTFDWQAEGKLSDNENALWYGLDPQTKTAIVAITTETADLHELNYGGDTLGYITNHPADGGDFFLTADQSRSVVWVKSHNTSGWVHVLDTSVSPATFLDSHQFAYDFTGRGAIDPDRDLLYGFDDTNNAFVALEFVSGGAISEIGRVAVTNQTPNITYRSAVKEAVMTGSGVMKRIGVTDATAPSVLADQSSWPNSTKEFQPAWSEYFSAGEKLALANPGSGDQYFATVDTDLVVGPDKPTIFIDAVGDESADLSSSAYSHPDDVAHQDSRWQVRDADDTDWTSPVYDSGWTTSDLEAHTASPLPLDDDLEARVAHRDTNGNLAWSDPKALSTTGTIKEGEGPEGLFFGEEGGNRILRFGRAFQDDGTLITAVLESNHIAPAGARGEVVVRSAHLSLEYGTDLNLILTPIIDGTEVTEARATVNLSARSRIRETIEVALAQDVTDSAGNPVATVGLRGSWLGMKIEATDKIGHGLKVNLESVEYEIEVVREEAESANVSA